MNSTLINQILEILRIVILGLGTILAVRTTKFLVHQENVEHLHRVKRNVIVWLMWGMMFLFLSSLTREIFPLLKISSNWTEGILIFHYLLFIIALTHFWKSSSKVHHLNSKDKWFFLGIVGMVLLWLIYLEFELVLPNSSQPTFSILSPLIISLMFVLSYPIHVRIRAGLIDRSLGYISTGVFLFFLGYMLQAYLSSKSDLPSILTVIPNLFYLLSAGYYLVGFKVGRRKFVSNLRKL
ncbi:MAG: hypothetical protein WCV90_06205 [Candidatus Woesearchaeota archaeon]|jgi:hypothetical protein